MAAVWAAGPEPMMTTLLCIVRERAMTGAGAVGFCFVREAAATRGSPELLLRREAERRKAEENTLADFSWVEV